LPKLHLMASTTKWPAVLMRSMRVHQWVKNVLIFLPLIASHRIFEPDLLPLILAAFASFCLCASGIYLVNDLVDLEADRQHHRKKNRPLAAGDLPLSKTMILVPALLAAGILVGTMAGLDFLCVLLLYLLLTSLYSFYLKRTLLLDVVFLASLYTVRIFAGSEATQIPVSRWLLAFSLFLFFSLALLKRYTELIRANGGKIHSRSYLPSDAPAIFSLGAASGFIAVLVSALYVTSPEVGILYHNPDRLWFVVPLLLLWISRIWLLGHRNLIDDDPVVFSLRDPGSYALGALTILVMLWAN
jgi:4-hydroxybenzoate polyprenyltransferase